jgi:hypothetical protein
MTARVWSLTASACVCGGRLVPTRGEFALGGFAEVTLEQLPYLTCESCHDAAFPATVLERIDRLLWWRPDMESGHGS